MRLPVEQTRTTAEVRATTQGLALALAAVGAGVYEVDYQAQTAWFSSEFVKLIGRHLTPEETFSEVWPIFHADDTSKVKDAVADCFVTHVDDAGWEARVILPDGTLRWTEWRIKAKRDPAGAFIGVVGLVLDIEERKRREAELQEARREVQATAERLRLAMASARAAAFEIDVEAGTFWCSHEFENIAGRKLAFDDVATPAWSNCYPGDKQRVGEAMRSRGGAATPIEWRLVRPDGGVRWVETNGHTHLSSEGEVVRVVGFMVDIDDRKRQELALIEAERAASAANEAKAQFLANMSHEIRTPMNGVLGILHLLHEEPLTEQGQALVAQAEGCGQMLAQILDDVIDLSKIDAGRLELNPETADVASVLHSVVELLRPQAEAKKISLSMHVEGLDGWAMVDPVRVRQALFNLIGNAIKFTARGGVQARLFVGEESGAKRLRFEIEDTGVGIPEDAQARLFQRFQQADGSTARQFGGSGLGLVITRALADIMGGEVGFTSVEGKGSTFWLDVPAPAAEPPLEAMVDCLPSLEGMTLLVVEDNAVNRLVATKILEGFGAEVHTADDGVYGVEAVEARPFDLVLMDVQMPRMDGMEATRKIRALPGPVAGIPIVGLTANVMLHQWKAYREAGMDGVACKPISPRALLSEIGRVLGKPRDSKVSRSTKAAAAAA
jgi:PAS domain S-box-containing protein